MKFRKKNKFTLIDESISVQQLPFCFIIIGPPLQFISIQFSFPPQLIVLATWFLALYYRQMESDCCGIVLHRAWILLSLVFSVCKMSAFSLEKFFYVRGMCMVSIFETNNTFISLCRSFWKSTPSPFLIPALQQYIGLSLYKILLYRLQEKLIQNFNAKELQYEKLY